METAKITSKGQITIPKKVRELLDVESGDWLAFELDGESGVRAIPVRRSLKPLRGLLAEHVTGRRVDGERIRTALRRRAARKYGPR